MFIIPLCLFFPLVVSAQDAGPTAAKEATHDLRVELRSDQPLLVELRLGVKHTLEVDAGGTRKKLPFEHESRLDFVEELLARDQPAAGDLDVRRSYLMWQEDGTDERGKMKPQDSSFGGARALITLRGGEISVELENRLAPEKELQRLLKHSGSVSWLELPASARVGETFEVEPVGLVNMLLDESFVIQSALASFTLRSVDEAGVATLDGPLQVMADDPEEKGRGTFEGSCSVTLDTRAKHVRGIQWKGQSHLFLDDGQLRAEGKGTFDARLAVTAGTPAKKALERKTAYRNVPRALEKAPVVFELPSHWYEVEAEEGSEVEMFRTTVHGPGAPVTIEFQAFAVAKEEFDTIVGAAVGKLEKELRLDNQRNVTSPLGKGRSMRFRSEADDGTEVGVQVEFYPCGKSQLLRIRLSGPPDAFEEEVGNWSKILRTLALES